MTKCGKKLNMQWNAMTFKTLHPMWTMPDGFAISDTMLTLKYFIAKDIVWKNDLEILQCRNIASNVDFNTLQKKIMQYWPLHTK